MRHIPVLIKEVVEFLQLKPGMKVVDCTLGDAGHSEAMLEAISPKGLLLGIDADPEAILRAKRFLYRFGERVIFARDNFVNLSSVAAKENFGSADAVLLDLGWSTPQFAERGRGFSFSGDEPLDMRFDPNTGVTAADIINNSSEEELKNILKNYGEEKLSAEIAAMICEKSKIHKLEKTGELVKIVLEVYRKKLNSDKEIPWIGGLHPATKTFQALRIAVNDELNVLKKTLPEAVKILSPGGRLAVISFHSLEDRIVKQYFQANVGRTLKIITKKPIMAAEEEIKNNPRAESAKLRVIERI